MKCKVCKSQDICERGLNGRCTLIKYISVNIESCSLRQLTYKGKMAVRKGERK